MSSLVTLHKILPIYIFCSCSSLFQFAYSQTNNNAKSSNSHPSTSITILGRDYKKSKDLQEYNGSNFGLNLNYFKTISASEKAILGFIATYAGTDCDLEYEMVRTDVPKYNCRLTLALGIGYQCSAEYLAFERKWFRNDTVVLKELKDCAVSPSGASQVSAFGEIVLSRSPGRVKVYFQKNTFNIRSMRSAEWTETFYFKVDADEVRLIKRTYTKAKVD